MKKMIVCALLASLVLGCSACKEKSEQHVNQGGSEIQDDESVGENDSLGEESEESNSSGIEMSDKLEDFTISINGKVYQFPCDLQVFLDDGWAPRNKSTLKKELNWGEDNCMMDMYYQGDEKIYATFFLWNNSYDARQIQEVQAAGIGYMSPEIELIFPGNFHFVKGETTADDVIAKYGGNGQNYNIDGTDRVYVFYDYGDIYSFEFCKNITDNIKDNWP